jgi:16S rRNA (cytosine1402-N4)-methyltransferase
MRDRADADDPAAEGRSGAGRNDDRRHIPVLVNRVDELLAPAVEAATTDGATDVVLVDATLGMGGHTLALLQAHPALRVVGIDRDPQALAIADDRSAR